MQGPFFTGIYQHLPLQPDQPRSNLMHIMCPTSADLLVSVSGIRGIVGSALTPETALRFAQAYASTLPEGRVLVGRDSRPSGVMLEHAVLAGLLATGCEVLQLGVVPTPTLGFAIRQHHAVGGLQITASHNPAPYNGLKLFSPDGMVLDEAEGAKVRQNFYDGTFRRIEPASQPVVTSLEEPWTGHLDRVLERVNVSLIRSRRFRVLLDANGGAGGLPGLDLLDRLTWQHLITAVGCEADGNFAHEPEPLAEHLSDIAPLVRENGCDVGFALDPDADRLAIIDEQGRYIGEELTLALAAECRLRREKGPVVINLSTSRVVEDVAARHGCPVHRVPVGEFHVARKMREINAVIGGEGNGGVIDPAVGWVRDPFVGMASVLELLAETGKSVSELVAELPAYHIHKAKVTLERDKLPRYYEALVAHWPEATAVGMDGLRLSWNNRWLHVRPSNTEPVVRIIAEAPEAEMARQLIHEALSLADQSN
ncbi:MAG: phosphoglucosamine mutase [Gemmatales bacterium]|nr:phosphoglucosamine mutase [Gemmatales bacterium]MDW8387210.1 phosphoglucosamine mutase [Gemmatales bacterium]